MDQAERLAQVTSKTDRANQHIADLETKIADFFRSKPYEVSVEIDSGSRKPIYYLSKIDPIPVSFALIAGDAIQNLVSALDHLAYQLVCVATGDNPPSPSQIYFPIASSAESYEASKAGKTQGASAVTIEAFDRIKPYKGGNDLLWQMQKLNNIDKHRLLFTVGTHAFVNLAQSMVRNLPGDVPDVIRDHMQSMNLFIGEKSLVPLEPGHQLYIGAKNEEPDANQQFSFKIAIHEVGIVECQPVLDTLREFAAVVENITNNLAPLLD